MIAPEESNAVAPENEREIPDPEADRIEEILGGYIDRLNAGEILDRRMISREHPRYATEILDRLEVFRKLESDADAEAPLGTLGDYTLRRRIGRGGMAVVYEAWQGSMERRVALKVLPVGVAADDRAFQRFMREARTAGRLEHASIVPVYGLGIEEQTPYYAMEYVEGETLAQVLARIGAGGRERTASPFGSRDRQDFYIVLADAFGDVACGLQHAHSKGVVHRDIKPSNLILDAKRRLRILDFGLAWIEGQESLTLPGDVVGTPLYMSPEQARRRKIDVDHRTDVYSLGATMYEAFTGRPPFRGKDHQDTLSQVIERDPLEPRKVNPNVPASLETIVLKCLRKDPAERYGTAEALAQDLRRFVRGDPVEARPEPGWERFARRAWRHRSRIGALASVALLALASLVLLLGWLASARRENARLYARHVTDGVMRLQLAELTLRAESGRPVPIDPQDLFHEGDFAALMRESGADPIADCMLRLEKAIETMPAGAEAHYHRARALALRGDTAAALESLDRALGHRPGFVPAAALREELSPRGAGPTGARGDRWSSAWLAARDALRSGRWDEAASAYGALAALARDGNEPYLGSSIEFHVGRGLALMKARRLSEAIESFVAAATLWPASPEPCLLQSMSYYQDGRKEDAERILRELHSREGALEDHVALWCAALYKGFRDYERGLEWANRLKDERLRLRLQVDFHNLLGRLKDAIRIGRDAVVRFPEDARTHHFLAVALLKFPETVKEGLDVAVKASRMDPDNVDTLSLLAAAHLNNGDPDRAEEILLHAIDRAPRAARPYTELGIVLVAKQEWAEAERRFRESAALVEANPRHHFLNPHVALADLLLRRGRPERCLEVVERGVRLWPESAPLHYGWGVALNLVGRHEEAEAKLRRAVDLSAKHFAAHNALGVALWRQGKKDVALVELRKARDIQPREARSTQDLAWALEEAGEHEAAFEALVEHLEIDGTAAWIHESLISLEHAHGGDGAFSGLWDRVADLMEKTSRERGGESALSLAALAEALLHGRSRRDHDRALELAGRSAGKSPDSPHPLAALAEALFAAGRKDDAVRALEKAVRLPRAKRSHAERLARTREALLPDAVSCASIDALLEGPGTAGAPDAAGAPETPRASGAPGLYLEARRLQAAGNHEEALERLFRLTRDASPETDPPSIEPWLRLAECHVASGRPAEAERVLRERLADVPHDERLWEAWIRTSLVDLALDPRELLESFPDVPAGGGAGGGRGADIRWLLEGLRDGKPLRVNCGAVEDTPAAGATWSRDRFHRGGVQRIHSREIASAAGEERLHEEQRRFPAGECRAGYRFPLPPGRYRVVLAFAEIDSNVRAPARFDVLIEGEPVLTGLEPIAAGFATAVRKTLDVEARDGFLDIELAAGRGDPSIAAIEITTGS
jgi:serine/threonine protein kinase/tetratricopeptide (TPR) repeat protein